MIIGFIIACLHHIRLHTDHSDKNCSNEALEVFLMYAFSEIEKKINITYYT